MKAIDHLHRVRGALADTVRIQGTAIAADHGDRRMLGQPRRDGRGRAIGQQVYDAVIHEIDHDRAIPVTSPPGPFVDTGSLEGWLMPYGGRPYETQERCRTGG